MFSLQTLASIWIAVTWTTPPSHPQQPQSEEIFLQCLQSTLQELHQATTAMPAAGTTVVTAALGVASLQAAHLQIPSPG